MSEADALGHLLAFIEEHRGFSLGVYKASTLERRLGKRLADLGIGSYEEYQSFLEVHPGEFTDLFDVLLINVTEFFRDPDVWAYLREEVVPRIVRNRQADEPIRVWSAGCASGEEAYALAMLFAEALEPDDVEDRLKVYATDADENALGVARRGEYVETAVAAIPDELRERYLEPLGGAFSITRDLRRAVIFGNLNVTRDAPISRLDLLSCRNTLMYFNREAQDVVLSRFHFALKPHGVLVLGRAELLVSQSDLFVPEEVRHRVFSRRTLGERGGRGFPLERLPITQGMTPVAPKQLADAATSVAPVAQIVIDSEGRVVLVNREASRILPIDASDVGKPLVELDVALRPIPLSPLVEASRAEGRSTSSGELFIPRDEGGLYMNVHVIPLVDRDSRGLGLSLTYENLTAYRKLEADLRTRTEELETAYEELQSTNEELETTNEEITSTNEEVETTNEELQSTNEELETLNEELKSSNEQLQSINELLRDRSEELDETRAFLETVISSIGRAAVVVDRDICVRRWTALAEDLWGLREEEVLGTPFLDMDIGLPVEALRAAIGTSLSGAPGPEMEDLAAIDRRGKPITVRVSTAPLVVSDGAAERGVIMLMERIDG